MLSSLCISRASRVGTLALAVTVLSAPQASADITAFLGTTTTPDRQWVRGLSAGFGVFILGFEVEYAAASPDARRDRPGLRTWSGNVLLQTPTEFSGLQLYGTAGLGPYWETLGTERETSLAVNLGGGAKIRIAGPLRLRVDYRVFRLQGSPRSDTYQRLAVGVNLAF